jgi:RNA-binding protein
MTIDPQEPCKLSDAMRRELASRARALEPSVNVGARGLTDAIVAQVRQALRKHELIKVKVRVDSAQESDAVGQELADRVPCHLVQRIGKVVVLYAPKPQSGSPQGEGRRNVP